MKLILSTACVLLSVAALADTANVQTPVDQLLRDVVSQLPTAPLNVSCDLLVRKRRGVPISRLKVTLDAHWGATPPRATYTIHDAFGRTLEQLSITHGRQQTHHYAAGSPLKSERLDDLSQAIQETDLSWVDLTLSFLWWPGGRLVGEESIRTFDCYVVELDAPAATTRPPQSIIKPKDGIQPSADLQPPTTSSPYSKVRLWISKKTHMMLQAEGYGRDGAIKRRLWVRSCKKIEDQWMIKEMEVQHYPVVHRTKLRVTDLKIQEPSAPTPQAPSDPPAGVSQNTSPRS